MRCCNQRLYPITSTGMAWIGQVHARVTVYRRSVFLVRPPSDRARRSDPNASLNANIASSSSSFPVIPIDRGRALALAHLPDLDSSWATTLRTLTRFRCLSCCDDDVLSEVTGLAKLRVTLTRSVIGDVMPLDDEPRSVVTCHSAPSHLHPDLERWTSI